MNVRNILAALLLVLPLMATTSEAAKKKTVWERPNTLYQKDKRLNVTKVEFSDTATTLHLSVIQLPGYIIRLTEGNYLLDEQGNRYVMKSTEGITPGVVYSDAPETGERKFIAHFEALPKNTRIFDFIENSESSSWLLYGIHNADKDIDLGIPKELRDMKYTADETLPATIFNPGKTRLSCHVYGYRPAMKMKLNVRYYMLAHKGLKSESVSVNDDGTANIDIDLETPTSLMVDLDDEFYTRIYVVPGEDVSFALNLKEKCFFGFTGNLARTNYEMSNDRARLDKIVRGSHREFVDGMINRGANECTLFLNTMLKNQIDTINSRDITSAAKQLWRMKAEEENIDWRYNFKRKWKDAMYNLKADSIRSAEDYNNFLKNLNTPDVRGNLETHFPEMECLNSEQALFNDALLIYSTIGCQLPISNKHNRQLAMTNAFLCEAAEMDEITEAAIGYDYMKEKIAAKRAADRQLVEELGKSDNVFFHTYDDVEPENLLPTILKKYDGRAVFIDIWATWCGSCRMGHAQMAPLKEELKGENVVFVYLSPPSSPSATWSEMLKEIPGEHYYLTKEQYMYLLNKYEIPGIPTYLLFDTKGKLSFKHIGTAGNDVFRSEIEKAMR